MAIENSSIFGQDGDGCQPQAMEEISAGEDTTIHSGHFMLSRVHDNTVQSDEEDDDEAIGLYAIDLTVSPEPGHKGFDFYTANKETSTTYKFGNIDGSLSKLFECMTLAYSGKLSSPKWKPFRGMHLKSKDKVRLNNIIWREWHMQYIYGKKPIVCQFATPLSDDIHTKPEAIVLEGKYWKRKLDTVTAEYKRWRRYFKARVIRNPPDSDVEMHEDSSHYELLRKLKDVTTLPPTQQLSATDILLNSTDISDMDFSSDILFSSLNQPFAFPIPRDLSGYGFADLIQPGLAQLQPPLEDYMDTLDPLQEMIASSKALSNNMNNSTFTGFTTGSHLNQATATVNSTPNTNNNAALNIPTVVDLGSTKNQQSEHTRRASADAVLSVPTTVAPSNTISLSDLLACSTGLSTNLSGLFQVSSPIDTQTFITESQMDQLFMSQMQQKPVPLSLSSLPPAVVNTAVDLSASGKKKPVTNRSNSAGSASTLLLGGHSMSPSKNAIEHTKSVPDFSRKKESEKSHHQVKSRSSNNQLGLRTSPGSNAAVSSISKSTLPSALQSALASHLKQTSPQKASAGSNNFSIAPQHKSQTLSTVTASKKHAHSSVPQRDGFAVPTGKPVSRVKQRTIAPAPTASSQLSATAKAVSSSAAHQNTYLAQLLTTGTYPGAIINVKKEPAPSACSIAMTPTTFTPIRPAETLSVSSTTVLPTSTVSSAVSIVNLQQVSQENVNPRFGPNQTLISSSSNQPDTSISDSGPLFVCGQISEPTSPTDSVAFFSQVGSPGSEIGGISRKYESEKEPNREHRRVSHISAEQKRRCNIKSGFDTLHSLIPSLSQNPNAKISKAAMLQKTAEFCKKLKRERVQMQNEADILRQEIDSQNTAITLCQSQLPATGVPVTRQRADQMKEMFEDYVKSRTLTNWKFWIFSIIIRNLFDTFNNMVSTASVAELCRTVLAWLDQHCSLVALRPTVSNALRHLSTSTSILSDPARVPEQAAQAVIKGQNSGSKS
ncbi:hypothetical protein ScPMuIL_006417 [Solemya velum]